MQNKLDATDEKILRMLKDDGRLGYSEMGKALGLSRTAIKNRVQRLEEEGFILGYHAVVRQGGAKRISFLLNVEVNAENFALAKERLSLAKQVKVILQTTGNCHLVLLCSAADVAEMRAFVNQIYQQVQGITCINAHAILEVIKGEIEI